VRATNCSIHLQPFEFRGLDNSKDSRLKLQNTAETASRKEVK